MSALALQDSIRELGGQSFTRSGLVLRRDITIEQLEALGLFLGISYSAIQFAMGDLMQQGVEIIGDEAYQAFKVFEDAGISEASQIQYKRVSERVTLARRRDELSWTHHRLVSYLEPEDQTKWLGLAVKHAWSKRQLDEALHEADVYRLPSEKRRPYVMEQVCDVAVRVREAMTETPEGDFLVPGEVGHELIEALPDA